MENKIRILHVVQCMKREGIETMLMNYYRNIDREVVQFDFLMTDTGKCDYENEIINLGGKIYRVSEISIFSPFKFLFEINKFFKMHKDYKIVHSHRNSISTLPLFIAKLNQIPIRISHSHISKSTRGFNGVIKQNLKIFLKYVANNYFACGTDAASYLYGKWFFKNENCYLLNNAIDAQLYAYNPIIRSQLRKKYDIEGMTVIGHVGRFNYQKNHEFIIDVFKLVHDQNPNTALILIGDGELRASLEQKISLLGLQDSVIMPGVVSNVYDYLQAIDVYLFPSLFEGLSLSIIEAQAAGLRCVASDSISKESKITDLVEFLSLSQELDIWADRILNIGHEYKRNNTLRQIQDSGYDVKKSSKWLENFYLEKYNELNRF